MSTTVVVRRGKGRGGEEGNGGDQGRRAHVLHAISVRPATAVRTPGGDGALFLQARPPAVDRSACDSGKFHRVLSSYVRTSSKYSNWRSNTTGSRSMTRTNRMSPPTPTKIAKHITSTGYTSNQPVTACHPRVFVRVHGATLPSACLCDLPYGVSVFLSHEYVSVSDTRALPNTKIPPDSMMQMFQD